MGTSGSHNMAGHVVTESNFHGPHTALFQRDAGITTVVPLIQVSIFSRAESRLGFK